MPEVLPLNLQGLHLHEEALRKRALSLIQGDDKTKLHFEIVEAAMDLADTFRQLRTEDQDLKVIQLFSLRVFNALGSSLKLALSGYNQNAALILRDVLETVFLLDYFTSNRGQISRWRHADSAARQREFRPIKIREALDTRDGFTGNKRHEMYKMFSELASHPTMNSVLMLRPERGGDAVIGPFVEATGLKSTIAEMGRLAAQVGVHLDLFFPETWQAARPTRHHFIELARVWRETFYGSRGASGLKHKGE